MKIRRTTLAALVLTSLAVFPAAPQAASASHGGNPPAQLPADFPSSVPLPKGTLQAATGSSPSWSVLKVVRGGYTSVMQGVTRLYTSHAFAASKTVPFQFANATYTVRVVGANRDHSNTKTNVTVWVVKR
jgi:hypothetical protein